MEIAKSSIYNKKCKEFNSKYKIDKFIIKSHAMCTLYLTVLVKTFQQKGN